MRITQFLQRSCRKNKSNEEVKDTYYVKMEPKSMSNDKTPSDLFQLPLPVVKIIQHTEDVFSSQLVTRYKTILVKFLEWTFFYLLSYLGFGFGWVLFLISLYYLRFIEKDVVSQRVDTIKSKNNSLTENSSMSSLPSWISFPDFDRVEWINQILSQLWTNIDCYATFFIQTLIEPELHKILDLMQLDQLSGFRIKRVDLGASPARVEGIKVYDKKYISDKTKEIVLDCDVVYAGDARVVFTLQGISAQIKDIKFRGTARIHLKPLLTTFPFVGGFEMYFIEMPSLEYGLGGIGTFGEAPGVNSLIRSVVEDVVRSRFVWPSRLKLYFPLDDIKHLSKASYMLPHPAGLLIVTLKEARDLLKKDKHIGGSGKSDPYAIISIGERRISFRNRYVPKTVNPTWDYTTTFIMEDPADGQDMGIEVYDFDAGSADDFLGKTFISLTDITQNANYDKWITLSDVKHGDIHVCCDWKTARAASDDTDEDSRKPFYIVSAFIDRCHDLVGGKSGATSLYPKCKIRLESGKSDEEFNTLPRNKTEHPVFEEGCLFTSRKPDTDKLVVEVIDVKGIDSVIGTVTIPIESLILAPDQELMNKSWSLDGAHPKAKMYLSSKLFIV